MGSPFTTLANGAYSFGSLTPGSYKVCFTTPSGYSYSPALQGGNTATDSDANAGTPTGCSAVFTLASGDSNTTIDAGMYQPATIGNKVWLDENGDGRQDPGEQGIANVTVELWKDNHNTLVATTATDADGNYIFKNLTPGTYQVDVLNSSLPTGLVQSTPTFTGDFTNKLDPYTVTVTAGVERPDRRLRLQLGADHRRDRQHRHGRHRRPGLDRRRRRRRAGAGRARPGRRHRPTLVRRERRRHRSTRSTRPAARRPPAPAATTSSTTCLRASTRCASPAARPTTRRPATRICRARPARNLRRQDHDAHRAGPRRRLSQRRLRLPAEH